MLGFQLVTQSTPPTPPLQKTALGKRIDLPCFDGMVGREGVHQLLGPGHQHGQRDQGGADNLQAAGNLLRWKPPIISVRLDFIKCVQICFFFKTQICTDRGESVSRFSFFFHNANLDIVFRFRFSSQI